MLVNLVAAIRGPRNLTRRLEQGLLDWPLLSLTICNAGLLGIRPDPEHDWTAVSGAERGDSMHYAIERVPKARRIPRVCRLAFKPNRTVIAISLSSLGALEAND